MKWVLVTGDSRGLGNEIVKRILDGSDYSIMGISRKANEETAELEKIYGDRFVHVNFDLSETEKIKPLYLDQIKKTGKICGLVNNAAMAYDALVTNAHTDAFETMFRINVFSPILLTKYAIRDMLLHDTKGSIVHISSVSAHTGYKGLSMYAATKGALEAFSKNVAREWGVKGIRSNCVAPGFMETDMSRSLTATQRERIYKRTSLKIASDPGSVAETVRFLISDESSSITGQVILVDSGTI